MKASRPITMYGFCSEIFPEPVTVKSKSMIEKFRVGVKENKEYWYSLLPKERVGELEKVACLPGEKFKFPMGLWVKVIYDFAVAYKNIGKITSPDMKYKRQKLVSSLVPLYFGRTASFVKETKYMSSSEAEKVVEKLCGEFERRKPYLVERWFEE